jgi:hypothetical protein
LKAHSLKSIFIPDLYVSGNIPFPQFIATTRLQKSADKPCIFLQTVLSLGTVFPDVLFGDTVFSATEFPEIYAVPDKNF